MWVAIRLRIAKAMLQPAVAAWAYRTLRIYQGNKAKLARVVHTATVARDPWAAHRWHPDGGDECMDDLDDYYYCMCSHEKMRKSRSGELTNSQIVSVQV